MGDVASHHRCYVKIRHYPIPLTISLIGFQGHPLGVRITIFDDESCSEAGMFLFCDERFWRKIITEPPRKKKFIELNRVIENYNLTFVLKRIGYQLLRKRLSAGIRTEHGLTIVVNADRPVDSCIDQLENYINLSTVVSFQQALG
eukprot:TRINITY_DN1552_c0_g2_i2.p1 TRINITY_DN1552_c0_g2~~TRINITY_DN1552_c0_g2_i2.p1  ORF type:complete len:145 (+),score=12.77 TRINITY_DN1552_c0_g2_i2:78-512(+)